MNWSEIGKWFGHMGIYWLNFWRLAFVYTFGKIWFFVSVAGFVPLLRAAMQHEAQGRVQLSNPSRAVRGVGRIYQPYKPNDLRSRLRRR